ncbi:hypothetical protein TRIUR3_09485 [Triticum urartu]|uniref:Myb/SANT-like domain-containing protein n=1 Tax=Triticum urartu TaxID=4572 RepID=M7ZX61_TRIUA|nr:hypothetical protein TRIUR3_09485 [Triticum urartu]
MGGGRRRWGGECSEYGTGNLRGRGRAPAPRWMGGSGQRRPPTVTDGGERGRGEKRSWATGKRVGRITTPPSAFLEATLWLLQEITLREDGLREAGFQKLARSGWLHAGDGEAGSWRASERALKKEETTTNVDLFIKQWAAVLNKQFKLVVTGDQVRNHLKKWRKIWGRVVNLKNLKSRNDLLSIDVDDEENGEVNTSPYVGENSNPKGPSKKKAKVKEVDDDDLVITLKDGFKLVAEDLCKVQWCANGVVAQQYRLRLKMSSFLAKTVEQLFYANLPKMGRMKRIHLSQLQLLGNRSSVQQIIDELPSGGMRAWSGRLFSCSLIFLGGINNPNQASFRIQ